MLRGERVRFVAGAIFALAAFVVSGCGASGTETATTLYPARVASDRTTHTVLAGETVYHIAQLYGVSVGQSVTARRANSCGRWRRAWSRRDLEFATARCTTESISRRRLERRCMRRIPEW